MRMGSLGVVSWPTELVVMLSMVMEKKRINREENSNLLHRKRILPFVDERCHHFDVDR